MRTSAYSYGYGYGYGNIAGGVNNICITTIGNSGTEYGFRSGSFGEASPGAGVDGTELYDFSWDTATGIFTVAFGVAGATLIDNVNYMIIRHNSIPDANIANVDVTDYTFTDGTLATALALLTETCFDVVFVPTLIMDLDFNTLRGTKV